jgi:hypothetical protein
MWLLNKLKQINEAEMQKLGFKLTQPKTSTDINKSQHEGCGGAWAAASAAARW